MKYINILFACCALLISACGIKGAPMPPERETPEAPRDFHVSGREGCALLGWKAPEQVPESGYVIYRAELDESRPDLPVFTERARLAPEIFNFKDCDLEPEKTYTYYMKSLGGDDLPGQATRESSLFNARPPATPLDIRAGPGDRFIELSWRMPPDSMEDMAFHIYRGEASGDFSLRPVNSYPVMETTWTDGGLENDGIFRYKVRAVRLHNGKPAMEGPESQIVESTPRDNIAPLPPRGFSALPAEQGVTLRWLPNREPDLEGYYIYRRLDGQKSFVKLNAAPLKQTEYTDTIDKKAAVKIHYYITAVDNASTPNESRGTPVEQVFFKTGKSSAP